MNKTYEHIKVEKGIDSKWQKKRYFSTHDEMKKPFSILLPPPNVTGKLHLGHALDVYIPDTIIRYKKLKNFDVLWLPGMDHAGIATQSKVEDVLYQSTGQTRHDLGREGFVDKVWEWKKEYATLFRKQWSKVGLALDYDRERFTLDKKANKAVLKVFVDLYKKGYIYKGNRAINWDIKLQTALSNIEVVNEPRVQKMYYIKYPLLNSNEHLTIATVRTETLLSDVAVVYNPKDARYKHLKNAQAVHPITNKIIPLIADEYVDPNFGSGLMKLSAHAEVDIDIIQKHGLEINETIDKNGIIVSDIERFNGLERFVAREEIAKFLDEKNLLEKVEETTSNVAISDRSKTVVETLVMPQWFVKMDHFRDLILDNLKSKEAVKFFPKRFRETLKKWMDNVHDWAISRQLWWGHRIPVWYDQDGNMKVQVKSPGKNWTQDSDVLDTWFSSGLAPFVFMNWPEKDNTLLNRYYPTSLLVTGYDIIFFWVARMYFFGLEFMKQIPFKRVLMHGLIRDMQGRKMSKSLNNGIDPIEMIDKYGSDALRWSLITNSTPGMDIRFSEDKVESAWKISNKFWNIARFIDEMPEDENKNLTDADLWIMNKLAHLSKKINRNIDKYDFAVIGSDIYRYIFNELSGWYIELLKSNPSKRGAMRILEKTLIVLHPFMPFITDRIYSEVFDKELLEQKWPIIRENKNVKYIDQIIDVVTEIRKYREENNLSKKEIIYYDIDNVVDPKMIIAIDKMAFAKREANKDYLIALDQINLYLKQDESIKEKNKQALIDKIAFVKNEITRASNILSNPNFVAKAPKEKVDAEKEKLAKYEKELAKYEEELKCKY
ncbi:valine--tRNA ligase [Mycoplasmopsis gallinacea]|uniref:Valine--tRNA ligase n=1 Tax=Mycoplasmopsis gallinacea TaxID=29556 RepID=A0A6H0V320_9BACT|nr:valine--tRNA ligase [Mycoplasmopsis gallinacea]QIW62378.1 valine--tRNA ligase [Mycoplasmopsis gallinacea]